jgi:hypothetical protein
VAPLATEGGGQPKRLPVDSAESSGGTNNGLRGYALGVAAPHVFGHKYLAYRGGAPIITPVPSFDTATVSDRRSPKSWPLRPLTPLVTASLQNCPARHSKHCYFGIALAAVARCLRAWCSVAAAIWTVDETRSAAPITFKIVVRIVLS